jgi:DnaJ-class molecular chaperone
MPKKDYYDVLGVSRSAGVDEIKKAYKQKAKECHPDRNQGDKACEEQFKELSEAYSVLSNPEKKQQYDVFGHVGGNGAPGGYPGGAPWAEGPGGSRVYTWSSGGGGPDFNAEDIFGGGGGGGLGDLFSQLFGGAGGRGGRRVDFRGGPYNDFDMGPMPGRDLEAELLIGFDNAIRGGTHKFQIKRNGHPGTPPRFETISVKVPAGVRDGGRLRVPGKGEAGPDGAKGDLYLRVKIKPHTYFRRDGDDLHVDVPVTVTEAALGAKIEVPTLNGKARLKVPAGTQGGAVLRLRKKGAPCPKGGGGGDLYVHVQVAVPKKPDAKTKKLLEQLKEMESDPREGKF